MRTGIKNDIAERRPRGRPRAYEPQVALRQAMDVFWKSGYSGTSLDDIAAATGMNRPSLRAAFGDKRSIYLKALADYWELKGAAMREALEAGGPLHEALIRVYDAALSIYFSGADGARGCFVIGTAVTEAADDVDIRHLVARVLHRLDAGFEARFRSARDAGELRNDADPKALAMLASAAMQTIAIRARAGVSRRELRKFARNAASVICG